MYKTFISFALLTSSMSFAGYDEVKQELNEKLQMYDDLRSNERSLYGQWYLGGVIVGLENALFILYQDEKARKMDNNVFIE